jgi:hypothetical protein
MLRDFIDRDMNWKRLNVLSVKKVVEVICERIGDVPIAISE